MYNFKKMIAMALTIVMIAGLLSGCGGSGGESGNESGEETYEMVIGVGFSSDYYICRAYKDFEAYVEEASDGRINVNCFFDSSLTGDDATTCEMLSNGTMTLGEADFTIFGNYINNDDFLFTTIPYLMAPDGNSARWQYFMDNSELMQSVYDEIEAASGIRLLTCFDSGNMSVIYKGEPCVDDLSALKGLKIRSADKPSDLQALQALNINATPLAFTEIYTSLQQGVIEGVFTSTPLMVDYGFNEVCNQYLDFGMWPLVYINGINAAFYDSLPEDLQKVVDDGIVVMTESMRTYAAETMEQVYEDLASTGCQITYLEGSLREEARAMLDAYAESRLNELDPEFRAQLEAEMAELYAEYDAQNS